MAGLIWFVQVVHYPLFRAVGSEGYAAYQREHMRLTTWVVGPPMLIEAATAAALVTQPPDALEPAWLWWNAALLGVTWVSTWLAQVPRHEELAAGFNAPAHRRLVRSNLVRTICWTARSLILLGLARSLMSV